jgi:hypothetical protein
LLAELLAAQRVVEQCREDGAVAPGLDGFLGGRREKLARLVIAENWLEGPRYLDMQHLTEHKKEALRQAA